MLNPSYSERTQNRNAEEGQNSIAEFLSTWAFRKSRIYESGAITGASGYSGEIAVPLLGVGGIASHFLKRLFEGLWILNLP
jgi:hypothetical protein